MAEPIMESGPRLQIPHGGTLQEKVLHLVFENAKYKATTYRYQTLYSERAPIFEIQQRAILR